MIKKFMIVVCILLLLVSLNALSHTGTINVYYDGFWTNHRIYQSEATLIKRAKLKILGLPVSELSNKSKKFLFNDFIANNNESRPEDIIFILEVISDSGNINKRIIADSEYLYDTSTKRVKYLKNNEKDYLRCFFLKKTKNLFTIKNKLTSHCKKIKDTHS